MAHTVRPGARPPHRVRQPRRVPRSPGRGATPTQAALGCRVRGPTAGSARSNVRAPTGPLPGTLGHRASCARHSGLARRRVSRASSSVVRRALRQALCASLTWGRRPRAPVRRCGAAVRLPSRGGRRPRSARRAWGWAAGSAGAAGGSRRHSGPGRAPPPQPCGPTARWRAPNRPPAGGCTVKCVTGYLQ